MSGKNFSEINRRFVIGDIHGAYIPLKQCLERCGFDYNNDLLITLGDICDGWPYVYDCVEELLKIINRIDIAGNHDKWLLYWLTHSRHPDMWSQGGKGTAQSYLRACGKDENDYHSWGIVDQNGHQRNVFEFQLDVMDLPATHCEFFKNQRLCYKDEQQNVFVHAGFERSLTLRENQKIDPSDFYWNRSMWRHALSVHKDQKLKFKEDITQIFIGHTSTTRWTTKEISTDAGIILPKGEPITTPMHADIIWNLDTGAGSDGKLTIMDIDSKEYWQSDNVNKIYGDYNPRG